jgi:hypothetical protein
MAGGKSCVRVLAGARSPIAVGLHGFPYTFQATPSNLATVPPDEDLYPYTRHISLEKRTSDEGLIEVWFGQRHQIVLRGQTYLDDPHYRFKTAKEGNEFQSRIRDKELLYTFDIDQISSRAKTRYGEASYEQLKLWRNLDNPQHFLTFFANNIDPPRHMEFPIAWFQPLTETKDGKPVRLEFLVPEKRKFSFRRTSTERKGFDGGKKRRREMTEALSTD